QGTAVADARAQRDAIYVGHDEEHELAQLFDRVDRNDVRMRQLRGGSCLAQETFPEGPHLRWQELDCDHAVQPDLAGEIDDAHTAAAQLALQRVASRERALEGHKEFVESRGWSGRHACSLVW